MSADAAVSALRSPRRRFAALALALLAGCIQAPSQRIDSAPSPIAAVRVFVFDGPGIVFSGTGDVPFTQTLQRNGMRVAGFVTLPQALADLSALEGAWNRHSGEASDATHALVLMQQRTETLGNARTVRYEAVLWSATSRRLIWKSNLASSLDVRGRTPTQRVERLAGDILRGLARDGLVILPAGAPRDAAGNELASATTASHPH